MAQEYPYDAQIVRPWVNESSFQDILADQLRKAPWLIISLAGHFLVFAFVFLVWRLAPGDEAPPPPPPIQAVQQREDKVEEEVPEEDVEDVVTPDQVVDDFQIQLDDDMIIEEKQGEDANSESYEGGDFNFEGQGMGGGRGGKRGGRRRGRKGILKRNGGQGTQPAVIDGLRWLKIHQDEDGSWDADEFDSHCPPDDLCGGAGGSLNDAGLSGLALLAFLGDGHNPNRRTQYQLVVQRGINWIVGEMEEGEDDGLIGGRKGHAFLYNHALASLALCEAFLLSHQENLREPAQRAVNFILRARNPYKAWRYEAPPNGQNDTSVTGWMVFALKTAQDAELDIDLQAYDGAVAWFDEVTDSATGRCGYTQRGEPSARPRGRLEQFPSAASESLTAVALLCRIFMGESLRSSPILGQQAELLLSKLPQWSDDGSTSDMYYWYYGTFAMFQMGGKYWKRWNDAMKTALLEHQYKEGHKKGSWDPIGPWGEEGGRVYSTALCVLCLEVYYRYAQVLSDPSGGWQDR